LPVLSPATSVIRLQLRDQRCNPQLIHNVQTHFGRYLRQILSEKITLDQRMDRFDHFAAAISKEKLVYNVLLSH
jgi:hypothetical protein